MTEITANILTLLSIEGFGLVNSYKFLSSLESINTDEILEGLNRNLKFSITVKDWELIKRKIIEKLHKSEDLNIKSIPFTSENFPENLKELNDFPLVLFVKGNSDNLNKENSLAIVGTRTPTKYTINHAPEICDKLASKSQSIISGLALGCDTFAHKSSIKMQVPTLAILPNGLDQIYPKENFNLALEIIEYGGCLVSEYPIGIKPTRYQFVARDRIQAGLSKVGFLLESSIKGGSMHCMKKLEKLGRKISYLAASESSINSEAWSGNRYFESKYKSLEISPTFSNEEINTITEKFFKDNLKKENFTQDSLF